METHVLAPWPARWILPRSLLSIVLAAGVGAGLLAGCATAPVPEPAPLAGFLHDSYFAPARAPVGAEDLFTLSDDMRDFLRAELAPRLHQEHPIEGLIATLQEHGQLRLDYDAEITRTAAQAYAAHRGNCLSLVVMTAAFAKALGLRIGYQSVDAGEAWSLSGRVAFLNGHVNLTLDRYASEVPRGFGTNPLYTVDFLPPQDARLLHSRAVSEDVIVAMYLNNRAAESLARGEPDQAYWWVRAALARAPRFAAPYNTLGVVYLHHGDLAAARSVLEFVLAQAPRDVLALSNLELVYERLGLAAEAAQLRARLARLEPEPPFHYFLLGTEAMRRGDYAAARALFQQEMQRDGYNGQVHFWLGLATLKLGDLAEARRQIALAVEYSTSHGEQAIYAGKLELLRAAGVQ